MVQLEILQEWRQWQPGAIVDTIPVGVAATLIDRNIARVVDDPEPPKAVATKATRKRKKRSTDEMESHNGPN